ncbi:hypothetical protein [Candidatus Entotheonella palauensis]|uniref:hypothetical protein n=1 Tax=Candidatus Entotheonella palauensis TaxID=93172 RepID=UPI000B7C8A02|nr:hypothetical protein [Candidatus Entotheonella palauensis]
MAPPTRFRVTSATVTAVRPERADRRRLDHLRSTSNTAVEDHYFIVKLYLESQLPAIADAIRLYVGQEEIPKYNGFIGGLYFRVYDPGFFEQHSGEAIYVSFDGSTRIDTGVVLPRRPAGQARRTAATLPGPRIAALENPLDDSAESGLPTKSEVLGQ